MHYDHSAMTKPKMMRELIWMAIDETTRELPPECPELYLVRIEGQVDDPDIAVTWFGIKVPDKNNHSTL